MSDSTDKRKIAKTVNCTELSVRESDSDFAGFFLYRINSLLNSIPPDVKW